MQLRLIDWLIDIFYHFLCAWNPPRTGRKVEGAFFSIAAHWDYLEVYSSFIKLDKLVWGRSISKHVNAVIITIDPTPFITACICRCSNYIAMSKVFAVLPGCTAEQTPAIQFFSFRRWQQCVLTTWLSSEVFYSFPPPQIFCFVFTAIQTIPTSIGVDLVMGCRDIYSLIISNVTASKHLY